jgi:hypothetical protein
LWSDNEGKEITESEHEDDSNYEGEEEDEEGSCNGHDDSDVTSSVGNGIIIRRNGYEWSVNELKRMGQKPRRNNVVAQPGNKGEAQSYKTPTQARSLLNKYYLWDITSCSPLKVN